MSEPHLNVERRREKGKGFAKAIRRDGKIPGVFYMHGEESVPLIIEEKALHSVLTQKPTLITLQLDDQSKREAIIREIQRDPVTDFIQHVDFMGIDRGVKITSTVPVRLIGTAAGTKTGGIVEHMLREVEVECFPMDLPEHIDLNISDMEIGDILHVADLKIKNVRILTNPEISVVSIILPRIEVEEEEEEEAEAAEEEKPESPTGKEAESEH